MKLLSIIIPMVALATFLLQAEESAGPSGVGGKQVQSDPAPDLSKTDRTTFEYKVVLLDSDTTSNVEEAKGKVLNELGRQGWELVSVTSVYIPNAGSINRAYFKRLLRNPEPRTKN